MAASEHGFEGRKPAFFKVLIGEFRKKLRIPTNFYKHFEGKVLPRKSILRCADGRSWHVRVKKVGDSWFFRKGWSDFVDMYGLQTSEFVVFRYDGISNFDIIMYGKNGCEKKNGVNGCKKECMKQKTSTILEEQEEGKGRRVARFCPCCYKMRSHLRQIMTENEDKWVFDADSRCPLQLRNPHFATRFRPSHTRQMPISLQFGIQTGLSGHKVSLQTVLLDPSGKPWPVNTAKKGNGRVCFGFGWSNFVAGNEVVPGDICVFELTKCRGRSARTHNVFQVHIIAKDR
ncbi:putative B3 domain-containing protein Os03g0621600 [Aristolochia californica]|uniref:putative B3 domain-containing protein Os03g0621600 n=1 Tax=Aristolochia californica TaxID=171875 RepID=UPI0035DAE73B